MDNRNRVIIVVDKHCFNDKEIIIKRDDSIDESYEIENIESSIGSCHKDKELREEPCKRRNTSERVQEKHEKYGKIRIRLIETIIVTDIHLATIILKDCNDCKNTEIGNKVNKQIWFP